MMNLTKLSRYLSYILRHHPEAAGISLDEHGWANVEALIEGISEKKKGGISFNLIYMDPLLYQDRFQIRRMLKQRRDEHSLQSSVHRN